jgi:hypothetical protein
MVSFLQVFRPKFSMYFTSIQGVLHVSPISPTLTWSPLYFWWIVQFMKSSLWILLRYSATSSLLGAPRPQSVFFTQCERPSFVLIQNNRQDYNFVSYWRLLSLNCFTNNFYFWA